MIKNDRIKTDKNLFKLLTKDDSGIFYAAEKITNTLLKEARKSNYISDKVLYRMYNNLENRIDFNNENLILPVYTSFIEQENIDSSKFFSIKAPFELIHADIADINFLAKPSVTPVYCLLFVDLFTSKVYTYPMKKRSLLKNKSEIFLQRNVVKKRYEKNFANTNRFRVSTK